ncbi:MAG: sulfatase [bacterium]|nr:sulfatase [bacterium]
MTPRVMRGALALALVCGLWWTAAAETDSPRPNVVLLIIDTLRADMLGSYGFDDPVSPELDAMAAEGVRFHYPIAQCSWTRPSIGSLITSRYPRTLGLYKERDEALNDRFVTLAEALQGHGYTTFGITANPVINSVFNMHQGFDTYIDSAVVFKWMKDMDVAVDARAPVVGRDRLPSAMHLYDQTLEFATAHPEEPCLVYLNIMEMHEAWRGRKSLTRPELRGKHKGRPSSGYLDALHQVSLDTHGFAQQLTSLPGWEDTFFVILSDHGQGLGSHPSVTFSTAHGRLLYESQVRVPLILWRREGLKPANIARPVRLLDVMPTILEYVGAVGPEGMDGMSLLPLLGGEDLPLPDLLMTETQYRKYDKVGVYGREWKLFDNRDGHWGVNPLELQRVGVTENGKRTDCVKGHPEIAEKLRAHMAAWEAAHPRVPATPCTRDLTDAEREQLEAIGYLK